MSVSRCSPRRLATRTAKSIVQAVCLVLAWTAPGSDAAEVGIGITVRKDRVDRTPVTAIASVGDTIKWTSEAIDAGDAAKVRIILKNVGGNPFTGGGDYDSGLLALGAAIPATPAIVAAAATATPNVYSYEIRVFNSDDEELTDLRETRNAVWVAGARDGTRQVRGVFVGAVKKLSVDLERSATNDAEHLRDVIHDGTAAFATNWAARPTVLTGPTRAAAVAAIGAVSAGADDDDVFVFLYAGHADKKPEFDDEPDGDSKEYCPDPECDEAVNLPAARTTLDDDLGSGDIGAALAKVRGIKVVVISACAAAGFMDRRLSARSKDLPIPNSVVLAACGNNEGAGGSKSVFGHRHSHFVGSLVSGLIDTKPLDKDESPPEGVVAADPNPNDGMANGRVTVRNWFDYATRQIPVIKKSDKFDRVQETQTPALNDDFAPAGHKAADLSIFDYARKTISAHVHQDPPVIEPEHILCGCDYGDAPDPFRAPTRYPTRESSNGACHLRIWPPEWLGARVDGEFFDADVERDGVDFDVDLDEGDQYDDGVSLRLLSPGDLEVTVTVTVTDPDFIDDDELPRYDSFDPTHRLYLNAWADWNGDGAWSSGSEKIIGQGAGNFVIDPREDAQFRPDNTATYSFLVPIPERVAHDFYLRFRLDYGEDVGEVAAIDPSLAEERGAAQSGEVEDYDLSFWTFAGEAEGGTITFTVDGVTIAVETREGDSASEVAAQIAAAIGDDPTLAARGVTASSAGNRVMTTGLVADTVIDDPGLVHKPVPTLAGAYRWLMPIVLLLTLVVVVSRSRRA